MNTFHRVHAMDGLEEISMVICMNLVLLSSFSKHKASARNWEQQLTGFKNTLQRWNQGKKGKRNYTTEIIKGTLLSVLKNGSDQELIAGFVEAQGLDPKQINWDNAKALADKFAS